MNQILFSVLVLSAALLAQSTIFPLQNFAQQRICDSSEVPSIFGCLKQCTKALRKQCEDLFGDPWYTGHVCGAKNTGDLFKPVNRQNYGSVCQVCLQSNIAGYIAGDCQDQVQQINVGDTLKIQNSFEVSAGVTLCFKDQIYQGKTQKCIQKDTSDSIPPRKNCKKEADCKVGDKCFLGNCINKCAGILCQSGLKCANGNCIPTSQCQSEKQCNVGQICVDGKCIQLTFPCGANICQSSQQCIFGKCIERKVQITSSQASCTSTLACRIGFKCINNICTKE